MNYSESIKEVIASSEFALEEGVYRYYLVHSYNKPELHLQVIHNKTEITVVTLETNAHLLAIKETNPEKWNLLTIKCSKPFYCVGFLASITQALAAASIDVVVTSTFEYDLVLVQEKNCKKVVATLCGLGFKNTTLSL